MKPFNLEEAKAGKPVCTRSGKPVRIICYDVKGEETYPILALITNDDDKENGSLFTKDGKFWTNKNNQPNDLMMVGEKHEGYINLYRIDNKTFPGDPIFNTKREAENDGKSIPAYITTIKIEWEE